MAETAKPSPTPWATDRDRDPESGYGCEIIDAEGVKVTEVGEEDADDARYAVDQANSALIVKAVNSYEPLMVVARQVAWIFAMEERDRPQRRTIPQHVGKAAQAAIAHEKGSSCG